MNFIIHLAQLIIVNYLGSLPFKSICKCYCLWLLVVLYSFIDSQVVCFILLLNFRQLL